MPLPLPRATLLLLLLLTVRALVVRVALRANLLRAKPLPLSRTTLLNPPQFRPRTTPTSPRSYTTLVRARFVSGATNTKRRCAPP